MITESFDGASPAKINVKKVDEPVKADAVIFSFSHKIEEYVTETFECEKITELWMAHGMTTLYRFAYHGKSFCFFRTWVGAPACVGALEDAMSFIDTKKVIHFGGAGCLDKEIARGKVMVPTAAYRDEGASYHYAPASDYIGIKNAPVVAAFMKENGLPYVLGKTWTTDAFYRETLGNFEKRKADGCISVEMEGAAIQAMCDFRGLEVYMFFTSGDLLDAPEWTARRESDQVKHTQHDPGHFQIALALAEYAAER